MNKQEIVASYKKLMLVEQASEISRVSSLKCDPSTTKLMNASGVMFFFSLLAILHSVAHESETKASIPIGRQEQGTEMDI